MNKEQSADDPSVDLIRVMTLINWAYGCTIFVITYMDMMSLRTLMMEAALVKHDNMKDYSLVVD